jgi:hypothetical protein
LVDDTAALLCSLVRKLVFAGCVPETIQVIEVPTLLKRRDHHLPAAEAE